MVKQYLVDILVKKISTQEVNLKTGTAFKVDDILIAEYKTAVENILLTAENII